MNIGKWVLIGCIAVAARPVAAKVTFGVRAGLARTAFTQKVDLDYQSGVRMGYSIAGLADIPFYRRFSFRPEIALANQGGSYFTLRDEAGLPRLKYKADYYSLQIPLNVAFNIPISGVRMTVYAGPSPDFHLGGKMKMAGRGEEAPPTLDKKMKAFDFSVNSGIAVEYKSIFFSIDTFHGTSDYRIDTYENESPVYQNSITFSLGYFFR
ncbi:MAG: PorT family protein [Tannerellaceae bacterium]|jgi:hypothetical protein|nr:PorT family protein [Tannerellaceae bacterium]